MTKGLRSEQWDHTSAVWYALRVLVNMVASAFGAKDLQHPTADEIHPYRNSPVAKPVTDGYINDMLKAGMLPKSQQEAAIQEIRERYGRPKRD